MWPFSGGWHYAEPLISFSQNKLSHRIIKRKIRTYAKVNKLTVIGLSKWLQTCAVKSGVFGTSDIINLPNPIDTVVFSPVTKPVARSLLNLPQDKKIILFGAMGATSDPRKGFEQLSIALECLDAETIELAVFGSSRPRRTQNFKQKVHYLGSLHDDVCLRLLYSAADVMVVPSLQENLSNAIMESMACGTPVVGFDIGGNSDMIEHCINGYLAKPLDTSDLVRGIEWVLENNSDLGFSTREKVVSTFSSEVVVMKYNPVI